MSRLRFLFLSPAWSILAALYLAPLLIVCAYSLLTRGAYGGIQAPWTPENFRRLADPLYGTILLRSAGMAALATGVCLVLAFPLALFITRSGKRKRIFLLLVIVPFWTSFLVRTYAWMFLLRDTGLINTLFTAAGWISAPLPLLYNQGAVLVGLIYTHLPFMVLPLYATLERLDRGLLEAAADLGARPFKALTTVVLPLSLPGIFAGSVLVFIPCLGAYLTPDLLGGGRAIMIGNLVQNQFTTARDWPFGSAASLLLMGLVILLLMPLIRRGEDALL